MKITIEHLTKQYGDFKAVDDLNLEIRDGELVGLLGPSGCGKSTTLFMLSGLTEPSGGRILFEDNDVTTIPPEDREIGLVFQNYALYPHMTVLENIMFPLINRKIPKAEARDRAEKMAEVVHLEGLLHRKPKALSGGQQQRVAIARALVKRPKVLLLDEPLSNLDAKLRVETREEIRRIQQEVQITTIFVTHDQDEAMVMSDRICLLNCGKIEQMDTPIAIYTHPRTKFAAGFIGSYNVLEPLEFGRVTGDIDLPAQPIAIRPEVLNIAREKQNLPGTYDIEGTVIDSTPRGNVLRYKVDVNGVQLSADTLFRSFSIYENGSKVWLSLEKRNCLHVEEEAV